MLTIPCKGKMWRKEESTLSQVENLYNMNIVYLNIVRVNIFSIKYKENTLSNNGEGIDTC